jgi:hypothetical protein
LVNTRCFDRTRPQTARRSFLVGSFDTETDRFGDERKRDDGTVANIKEVVKICTFHHETLDGPGKFDNVSDFLEHILCEWPEKVLRRTIWYSHNAEFDWRFILAHFKEYDDLYEVRAKERAKNTFYELEIISKQTGKRVTRLRDSMALFGFGLAQFTKQFAPELVKQDIGLSYKSFNRKDPAHIEYALNDAKSLVVALLNFDKTIYGLFGVHIKGTISATAYAAMKCKLPEGEVYWRQSQSTEETLRLSYYGGRVQINAPLSVPESNVTTFDINSSYPAQMRKGVPKGKAHSTLKFHDGKPGFYLAEIIVPHDLLLPPIPLKTKTGLAFPTGVFETYCSSIELERIKALGGSFKVIEGLYFPEGLTFPFNDFIDLCEKTRASYKGTPTETVIKLIQNSVYGKFGTKTEGRQVIISFDNCPPDGYECSIDDDTGFEIPYLFFKEEPRDAEYMLPHWAAWITANARLTLDNGIETAGRENVRYVDTDSLHVTPAGAARMIEAHDLIGKVYGQYKLESVAVEEAYHGPKFYTAKTSEGEIHVTAKGIPKGSLREAAKDDPQYKSKKDKSESLKNSLHAGEQIEIDYISPTSLNMFLKTNKISILRKRRSSIAAHSAGHIVENGWFRPRRIACV